MKFKKHISIFIAILLLVSNTGLAFNIHFCADVVASITINSDATTNEIEADCCGITEELSRCCQNKIIKADNKSDQIVSKSIVFEISDFVLLTSKIVFFRSNQVVLHQSIFFNYTCNANAPPIFERNCQRVFYA